MNYRTFVSFVLATLFWGLNFHFGKLALKEISPNSISFYRFLFSAVSLLAVVLFYEKWNWSFVLAHFHYFFVLSFVGIFLYNTLFYVAMLHTSAVNASLIVGFNPVITALVMSMFFKKKISSLQVWGMLLSLTGVFTIISQWNFELIRNLKFSTGDLLMLVVTSTFVFYNVFVKRWLPNTSALLISTMITLISLPFFALTFYWDEDALFLQRMTLYQFALLWGIALGGSVLGSILWNNALKRVSPDVGAVFVNFIPLFAILTAPLFGEFPTPTQLIGGLLIISGVLLVNLTASKQDS